MADPVFITAIPESTVPNPDDLYLIQTAAGTRLMRRRNHHPKMGEFEVLLATDVNTVNDHLLIFDATTQTLKRISINESIFGNFRNISEEDDFTLQPGIHNVRPIQCSGNFSNGIITLDGNLAIEGCAFVIANFSDESLTVTPVNGVSLKANGVSGSGTIRQDRSATIIVSNGGGNAIFSGG